MIWWKLLLVLAVLAAGVPYVMRQTDLD